MTRINLTAPDTTDYACPPHSAQAIADSIDQKQFQRRVKLFKRAGMIGSKSSLPFTVSQATGTEQLKSAYRLVHDTFVEQGYILPAPGGIRMRPFEALPEMATFIAQDTDGRVVAVMSVVPDTLNLGLPSDIAFKPELDDMRRQGRRLGEVTNLAVIAEYRNSNVFLELARYMQAHAMSVGLDELFIAISPGHTAFFETFLCFEPRGAARHYGGPLEDTVEGMALNLRTAAQRAAISDHLLGDDAFLYDWFFVSNPHLDRAHVAHAAARQALLTPQTLCDLFVYHSQMIDLATERELRAIREQWGGPLFDQVVRKKRLKIAS
ncbi:MAG: N-acyl amino acid synthase FeeM domain-containing protein [Planctomycetota bacterium]